MEEYLINCGTTGQDFVKLLLSRSYELHGAQYFAIVILVVLHSGSKVTSSSGTISNQAHTIPSLHSLSKSDTESKTVVGV